MNTMPLWNEAPLASLCRAIGGGTPSRNNTRYWDGSIPWASVKDFPADSIHLRGTEEHVSEEGLFNSASNLIPPNTPLICTRMAVGRCALSGEPTAINQDVKALVHLSGIEPKFLVRVLALRGQDLDRVAIGSTVKGISTGQLLALRLRYPSIDEQARINVVLDSMDAAIEQTTAMIVKLKQVRAGLVHDLLTKGIDANGEIRDSLTHPSAFKNTAMGNVPISWSVEKLGARLVRCRGHIQTGPFGSQLHASDYVSEGVPVVMPQDIDAGTIREANIARISYAKADELGRHKLQPTDLVFARRGDLGRCAMISHRETGWLCGTGCLLMRFEPTEMLAGWLSVAYVHDICQRQVAARAVGTTMANLNTDLLNHLVLAFPPKFEQESIIEAVAEMGEQIAAEVSSLGKLKGLRVGLADDLLSGRVRVSAELELV